MFVSKDWLQTYFEKKLPEAERIAEVLNFHAFEVEEIKSWDTDEILDVKVLADRACYALSHRGIAGELSAGSGLKFSEEKFLEPVANLVKSDESLIKPVISVGNPALCPRYTARRVEGVKIKESPEWLRARLESIGERSINNVVDSANFVMFDIGQPLHAFDADKVVGEIKVRLAKKGEKMTTLDNRETELDRSVLVIADEEGPLAIAGIKGGKRAEVTEKTVNLILESANFNRSAIRLTASALGLKTEAARRFEANISPELAKEAMERFSNLIAELSPDAKFSSVSDVYRKKQEDKKIAVSEKFISEILGVKISAEEIEKSLKKLGFDIKEDKGKILVSPPKLRTDVLIPEDVAEEVGRIFGYEKIPAKEVPPIRGRSQINRDFYYIEKIKDLLVEQGFNEVVLYSFSKKGSVEMASPLSEDKKFLRDNLAEHVVECIEANVVNAPLLGISEIRIFEVGSVFGQNGERTHICIGRRSLIKKDRRNEDILREIIGLLGTAFGSVLPGKIVSGPYGAVAELDATEIFRTASSPRSYEGINLEAGGDQNLFVSFSQYPFILRDIAVFVPKGTERRELIEIIKKEGGEWLQRADLFDVFEKKMSDNSEKVSYAFHLVFQSMEKTLNDSEINFVMENITKNMNKNEGWLVR